MENLIEDCQQQHILSHTYVSYTIVSKIRSVVINDTLAIYMDAKHSGPYVHGTQHIYLTTKSLWKMSARKAAIVHVKQASGQP